MHYLCLSLPFCRSPPAAAPPARVRVSATPVQSPTTPSSAPQTPVHPEGEEPKAKRPRRPKAEEPVTPLAKGRDMASKLLKKKSDAANLALSLQNVPYAEQLAKEMNGFTKEFESFSCMFGNVFCEVYAV